MDILEMIERIERIDINVAVLSSVDKTINTVADFQRQQFGQGIQKDSNLLHWQGAPRKDDTYPYTKKYSKYKSKLGKQTAVVDLNLTGSFWNDLDVFSMPDAIGFDNKNDVAQYLDVNYNADKMYGLTDENKEKYIEGSLSPMVLDKIKEQTGL